ncbi:MAG: lysophospholipid acyltransferase family protein [Bacteroidota bacterium]
MSLRELRIDSSRFYKESLVMKMFWRFNSAHMAIAFAIPFLVLFPFFWVASQNEKWHNPALVLHNWWARIFFSLMMMPVSIEWKHKPHAKEQYIFCANHFSYLDIPAMGLLGVPFKFIGKQSLTKVPLFGYMFKKLHVPVERGSTMSRAKSQKKVLSVAKKGFNITYFPEGGMITTAPPKMVPFKDGAFRLAAELNRPIVPVSLCTNYIILPDDPKLYVHRGKVKMIVHKPIFSKGKDKEQIEELKRQVRQVIESGLQDNSAV